VIYICIPAHNEERTVGVLLWKIRQVMLEFRRDYQILVMDDASTDATAETLAPYARVLPLTILRNDERAGYARSLETLLREAVRRSPYPRRDVIVTLQADFTDEPLEIPALVKRIEAGADLVTGASRPARDAPRAVRWSRLGLGYLLRRHAWPAPVTDPLSAFRAYRVICLRRALQQRNGHPLLTREGWAANAELLRAVAPHARRVDETTVAPRYDRLSRATRFQPWPTLLQLLRLPRVEASNGESDTGETTLAGDREEHDDATGAERRPREGGRRRRRPPRSGQRSRRKPRVQGSEARTAGEG
jgi:hypothetical protein